MFDKVEVMEIPERDTLLNCHVRSESGLEGVGVRGGGMSERKYSLCEYLSVHFPTACVHAQLSVAGGLLRSLRRFVKVMETMVCNNDVDSLKGRKESVNTVYIRARCG